MRKKIIIIHSIIVLFALVCMLFLSSLIIYKKNYKTYEEQIKSYLNIAVKIFDGNNFEETASTIKNKDNTSIRITIIDLDGNVILDSDGETNENHSDRIEFQNLEKVYVRYSNTKKQNMLYIAGLDGNYKIRIAMAMGNINQILKTYITIGIVVLILIYALSTCLIYFISKKSMKPLIEKVNEIGSLANVSTLKEDLTIEELSNILNSLSKILKERINEIQLQMEKFKDVLNLLNQAIIVISNTNEVKIINNKAKEMLDLSDNIIDNDFIFMFQSSNVQNAIFEALNEHKNCEVINELDKRILHYSINYVNNSWLSGGAIITIDDITIDYNLNKTKKDFFQNASHELKSPLTSIIGYEQLIVEGIAEGEEVVEYSNKVLKEAKRMNNIIIDMLDLSSLEQNYVIKKEQIKIIDVVNNIISSLESRIKEKHIEVKLDLEDTYIEADYKLIDEMIRNLIDNAVKYNKDNGTITIIFKDNVLTIKDTGIGIPKEDQNRIFERFYCVSKGKNKEHNGTGLGLAIVKHICELNDYAINFESYLDIGTCFKIILK